MPKLGTSIRIIAPSRPRQSFGRRRRNGKRASPARQARNDHGRRQHVRLAARRPWITGSRRSSATRSTTARSARRRHHAITARTVDFGASDAPLSADQFTACNGCEQIPWALGSTSIMYNLPGVKNLLHMDGPTLAKIFIGQITTWNDPAIAKLNPGVSLPSTAITIAHRSDGSGTTYNLTDYLSNVSPAWKSQIGSGTSVNWPVGVGGKGSSGVSGVVASDARARSVTPTSRSLLQNHFSTSR